jgi:hypothetical protein
VACIAEVISRLDVIALQEARRSIKALRFLLERLGPNWQIFASDVPEGSAGNVVDGHPEWPRLVTGWV